MKKTNVQKRCSYIVFAVYLVLLIWLILFKLSININDIPHMRSLNLVPLRGSRIFYGRIGWEQKEIFYNILVFVPLGVYINMLKPNWSYLEKIAPGFMLSVLFETLQYLFAIGASDITDVLANTLGAVIGLLCYRLFVICFHKKTAAVINITGAVIEVCAVGMYGVLVAANLG